MAMGVSFDDRAAICMSGFGEAKFSALADCNGEPELALSNLCLLGDLEQSDLALYEESKTAGTVAPEAHEIAAVCQPPAQQDET